MVGDCFVRTVYRGSVNSGYCDAVFSARSMTGLVESSRGARKWLTNEVRNRTASTTKLSRKSNDETIV